MAISMIEHRNGLYQIFDGGGEEGECLPDFLGELLGWGERFLVLYSGSSYDTYDERGKKIGSIPKLIGSFVSVSGDIFVTPVRDKKVQK